MQALHRNHRATKAFVKKRDPRMNKWTFKCFPNSAGGGSLGKVSVDSFALLWSYAFFSIYAPQRLHLGAAAISIEGEPDDRTAELVASSKTFIAGGKLWSGCGRGLFIYLFVFLKFGAITWNIYLRNSRLGELGKEIVLQNVLWHFSRPTMFPSSGNINPANRQSLSANAAFKTLQSESHPPPLELQVTGGLR